MHITRLLVGEHELELGMLGFVGGQNVELGLKVRLSRLQHRRFRSLLSELAIQAALMTVAFHEVH